MVKEKAKEEVRGRQSGEWEEGKVGMTIKEEKGKIIQPRTCGEQEMERNACERVMLLPAVCHPSFLAADFSGDGGVGAWGGAARALSLQLGIRLPAQDSHVSESFTSALLDEETDSFLCLFVCAAEVHLFIQLSSVPWRINHRMQHTRS